MTTPTGETNSAILRLASNIVAAYVSKNVLAPGELSSVIRNVHATLMALDSSAVIEPPSLKPAVPIKKSVTDGYIVCLEDGRKMKMLKRYLRSHYNMTPEDYRAKWGLPVDYPMVAPHYAALRSEFAKKIGLGKSPTPRRGRRRT